MTETTSTSKPAPLRGRPQRIPQVERERGIQIEEHVALRMQQGEPLPSIARGLRVSLWALRRELRRRGYRGVCETRLVSIGSPPRPGRSVAAR